MPASVAGPASLVQRLVDAVCELRGWRRASVAFGLGILLSTALPPVYALPVLPLAFGGLLLLAASSRSPVRAFVIGWCFGFGHFLTSVYWIGASLLVDAERFGWLAIPAVVGLSALFAVFPAIAAAGVRLVPARGWHRSLIFAITWAFSEWLRAHILTGFAMNPIGISWTLSDGMIQLAALTGVFGISFVTVLAASLPITAFMGAVPPRGWRAGRLAAVALAGLALVWLGGMVRLAVVEPAVQAKVVQLRVVQGNIDQRMKWADGERQRVVQRHIELSREPAAVAPDIIIWPETAVPYYISENPDFMRAIAGAVFGDAGNADEAGSAMLITGAPRIERYAHGPKVWNSLYVISPEGEALATYDKHHLVPFGEYVPLREFLGLSRIVESAVDFSSGPGPQTLSAGSMPPFSPLICYEGIFPGAAVGTQQRPQWLLNITNDGWFGRTAGPHHHFQSARMRAVEEGLPLVRAANTGISAVIDSFGRVEIKLGMDRAGVIDAPLPPPLVGWTPYAALGDWMLVIGLGACLCLFFTSSRWFGERARINT